MYDLIIEVGPALNDVLRALVVEQDGGERADGVLVAAHHHVHKPHVVVGGHLAGWYTRVHVLQIQGTCSTTCSTTQKLL